jgi:adenylate cyclase
MSIRLKIVLVVLPLIITTLLLTGASSFFSATNAITGVAKEFLGFKAAELEKYATSQWSLLVENDMTERPTMVAATKAAVESYANSIVRSPTEVIFALDGQGQVAMSTGEIAVKDEEREELLELASRGSTDLVTLTIGGVSRVAKGFAFAPFGWYVLVSEQRDTFYSKVNEITVRTGVILAAAIVLGLVMVLIFAGYLTNPLIRVVQAMEKIISTNDLSSRVKVEYHDETGKLAHTFNIMVGALEAAYSQIKRYAYRAVISQKQERKTRSIFQRYVPADVIDQVLRNPEAALVGDNRIISILFSDIRDFTRISEGVPPDELVSQLNRYFTDMVNIIVEKGGTIDKYIGDAIMAFFGAPLRRKEDALNSVLAGIEMLEAVERFNAKQVAQGRQPFRTGIGINYGVVTVGNIGTDKKMDYTIIGDMVNLASRMEGLTKKYHQPLLISESLYQKVKERVPCRLIDTVAVKGKARGVRIYTAKKSLNDQENQLWSVHNSAMDLFYHRDFQSALREFQRVLEVFPEDYAAAAMARQAQEYLRHPPPADWNGVTVMTEK